MPNRSQKEPRRPTSPDEEGIELHPDAWERFERTLHKVVNAPPVHRTAKTTGAGRRGGRVAGTVTRAGEQRLRGYQEKEPVLTLVDGDKKTRTVRSFHIPEVNSATLRPILKGQIDAASWLMTDDASYYHRIGADYRRHFMVNHSIGDYVSGGTTTNARRGTSASSIFVTTTESR